LCRPARGRKPIRSGSRGHNYTERSSSDSEDADVNSVKLDSPIWSAVSDKLTELTDGFATRAKVRRGPFSLGSLQTNTGKKDFRKKFKAALYLMLDTLSGGDAEVKAAMLPLVLSLLGVGTGKRKRKRKARINPTQMAAAYASIEEYSRGFSWEVQKNHILGEKTTFLHRNISLTDMYTLYRASAVGSLIGGAKPLGRNLFRTIAKSLTKLQKIKTGISNDDDDMDALIVQLGHLIRRIFELHPQMLHDNRLLPGAINLGDLLALKTVEDAVRKVVFC